MPDVKQLSEDQIMSMKVSDAADFCGYSSLHKFNFDFLMHFKKQYKQMQLELRKRYILKHHEQMDDEQIARIFKVTRSSVTQLRVILGLHKRRKKRLNQGIYFNSKIYDDLANGKIDRKANLKITARIETNPFVPPIKYKLKIKKHDDRHASFIIYDGNKKVISGEYYHPRYLFNVKEDIDKFVRRLNIYDKENTNRLNC